MQAQIGPYRIDDELGRGGVGAVFRARAPDGRVVALKALHQAAPRAAERFAREARLQAELGEARGFVPILDAGGGPRGPWLVMPLMEGGSLRQRLRGGPLGVEQARALGVALARALGHAHARGIVHRDVKPENVLFTSAGWPLLADLGLAKRVDGEPTEAPGRASLSRTGELRGTLGYMAPEQLRDAKSVGPAADVFALGAVLYECLVGVVPFAHEDVQGHLRRLLDGDLDPVRRLRPEVPAGLAAVIERALALAPSARHADGAALATALEGARPRGRSRPRRAWLRVAALVASVACATATGLALAGAARSSAVEAPAEGEALRASLLEEPDPSALLARVEAALASPDVGAAAQGWSADARRAFLLERRLVASQRLASAAAIEAPAAGHAGFRRVLEDARSLEALDPARRPRWLYVRAYAEAALDLPTWRDPMRACAALDPEGGFGCMARALLALETELDRGQVAALARRALELEPRHADLRVSAAMALRLCGEDVEALEALAAIERLDLRPRDARSARQARAMTRLLEGRALTGQDDHAAAAAAFEAGLAEAPRDGELRRELVNSYLLLERHEDAWRACDEHLRRFPLPLEPMLVQLRGTAALRLGRLDQARVDLEAAAAAMPRFAEVPALLGQLHLASQRPVEALAACDRGLQLLREPGAEGRSAEPLLYLTRSIALANLGRREAAVADARKVIELAGASGALGRDAAAILTQLGGL